MKVLFLAHSFPRSPEDPVGSFVLRLAAALRPLGAEVLAIAPAAPGLPPREVIEGVAVERFRYAPRRFETLAYSGTMRHQVRGSWAGRAAMLSFLAGDFWKGLRSRGRFRAELIHAHWWYPGGLVGSWLKRWWRVPLVTTLHGSDLRAAQHVAVARPFFRRVLRRSDRVTVVSQWLADGVTALAPAAHPVVAPMPVLPDLFSPPPQGARSRNRLLFVGKLNEQKGITVLLHALAQMRAKPTVDVVVGVGSTPEDVRPLADSLGVARQLQWYPLLTQAELARRYQEATALVAPFRDEGLGLVAIEAQLSEAPVVAFRSGGLTDIVVHEQTGLLVPTGGGDRAAEVTALAAALDRLLALPDQGAQWGREGRRHALATFAPEATARRYLEIYRDALDPLRP